MCIVLERNLVLDRDVKKTLQSFIMEEVAVRRYCGAVPLASSLSYTLDTKLLPYWTSKLDESWG